jgi:hypothetical protein
VAGAVLRRRGRRMAGNTPRTSVAATGLSLALGAGLGLGAVGTASAAPKVDARIAFTHIQFNVFDLDAADGVAPSLTLPPAGSSDNSISSYIRRSDWGGESQKSEIETLPLPGGGLFGIQSIYESVGQNAVTLVSNEDAHGSSLVLNVGLTSDKPGNSANANSHLSLRPGNGGAGSPQFSFTLGPRSYVVLSMKVDVDVDVERSDIVGFTQYAHALGYWNVALNREGGSSAPTQSTTDEYRFFVASDMDQLSLHDSRTVRYAFYNPEDEAIIGALDLRAHIGALAYSSPLAVVPEADAVVMTMSGVLAVAAAARRRRKGH